MKYLLQNLAGLLIAALMAGCTNHTHTSASSGQSTVVRLPPRTEADAGVIVTNLARQIKIKLEKYQQPSVTFDALRHEWNFFYTLKPPGMPGGHFNILVDAAGKPRFIGGA